MLARLLHFVLTTLFSIYLLFRRLAHSVLYRLSALLNYHHKSPDRQDVRGLSKLPHHLSVVLSVKESRDVTLLLNRLDGVMQDACELVAWTAAAGIPVLSIYESKGLLKASLTSLHTRISQNLDRYYASNPAGRPTFSLRAPKLPTYQPPTASPNVNGTSARRPHVDIFLLDALDGQQTLVDLTKTLAEMTRSGKLEAHDISPELIDAELTESIMGEPDLLILFGDKVLLESYPPWQVRLTEIFALQDNRAGVGYNCFLRALYKYAKAEMRLGR